MQYHLYINVLRVKSEDENTDEHEELTEILNSFKFCTFTESNVQRYRIVLTFTFGFFVMNPLYHPAKWHL